MRARKFLIVAFLLFGAVTLYMRADVAPAGGAQPTNSGSVTVTDSAISPPSVTIPARGSVVWTNKGSRLHKIVASHGAFNAFDLAPAGAHRVSFLSPGVYPYTVDGAIKGAVVVLTGVPAAGASTGPSPTPGPPRHFWSGTIHATATYRTHVPCAPGSEGCGNDGQHRGGPYIGTYDGRLILAEDADGLITGQGQVSASGCKFAPHPAKHISFAVRGVDDGKGLSFHIILSSYRSDGQTCGFVFGLVETPGASPSAAFIPFTAPGTAQGPWHGRAELPPSPPGPFSTASFVVEYQFALTCTDCRHSP
jgi:plastocyanin